MLRTLAISGYRSLRDVRVELGALNVVTGPNGSGKSSLYRSLRLLADIAQGRITRSLALEGGLTSTLWAGPELIGRAVRQGRFAVEGVIRKSPVSLKLGYSGDDYGYAIDLGLPHPSASAIRPRPGNQGRRRMDRGSAGPSQRGSRCGSGPASACGTRLASGGRPTRASRLSTA